MSQVTLASGETLDVLPRYFTLGRLSLVAFDSDSTRVADLTWDELTGEITAVHVNASYRRQGVATALLRIAWKRPGPSVHLTGDRTDDGEQWALSLRIALPQRQPGFGGET